MLKPLPKLWILTKQWIPSLNQWDQFELCALDTCPSLVSMATDFQYFIDGE